MPQDPQDTSDIIALLPAGGQATRLSPLPLSKELYPIGFRPVGDSVKPKVVGHYLLEKMRSAGITKAFWIVRPGKWDIPAYFGDGEMLEMHLGYLTVHVPHGVPYTLNQAYPFVQQARVAIGFPDILFEPADAYRQLIDRQTAGQADVVLGLFPTEFYWKAGMVDFDESGRVHQVVEKPQNSSLKYMWAIALWTPRFTQFLHDFLMTHIPERELPIGDVVQAAIGAGLRVEAVPFADGSYLDVGTPADLQQAIRAHTPESHPAAPER
ncbi:MAG: sugar phosphate nucleotidyltransferase [Oculatellaceae cyanobacterium Prado106]|jgi:glucose-1-phosphate thymidylyltransferase|nr:sugar phosphate nucleotidyltransferase [Oculatellaceae cyanobacterium Prado106]